MRFERFQFFLHLGVYLVIWFSLAGLNHFAAMIFVAFPVHWVFVFFPAMTLPWQKGILLVVIFGLLSETLLVSLRGVYLPVFLIVYLLIYYRRFQVFEWNLRRYYLLASITHGALMVVFSLVFMVRSSNFDWQIFLQSLFTDWFCGQVLIFGLLPVLLLIFGRTQKRPSMNPELNELR